MKTLHDYTVLNFKWQRKANIAACHNKKIKSFIYNAIAKHYERKHDKKFILFR